MIGKRKISRIFFLGQSENILNLPLIMLILFLLYLLWCRFRFYKHDRNAWFLDFVSWNKNKRIKQRLIFDILKRNNWTWMTVFPILVHTKKDNQQNKKMLFVFEFSPPDYFYFNLKPGREISSPGTQIHMQLSYTTSLSILITSHQCFKCRIHKMFNTGCSAVCHATGK